MPPVDYSSKFGPVGRRLKGVTVGKLFSGLCEMVVSEFWKLNCVHTMKAVVILSINFINREDKH